MLPMQLDISDIHGKVQRSIKLAPDIAASDGGWSPAVSPDGRMIALASWDHGWQTLNGFGSVIRRFDLSSGHEVGDPVRAANWATTSALSHGASGSSSVSTRRAAATTFPPEQDSVCVLPAADAFAGPTHVPGFLEAVRAWPVTKSVVVVFAVVMTLMAVILWAFERRRLPGRPAPD
ncbi:MAG: hypothetical protein ABIM89_06820 [Mycobacteriales bacterium]